MLPIPMEADHWKNVPYLKTLIVKLCYGADELAKAVDAAVKHIEVSVDIPNVLQVRQLSDQHCSQVLVGSLRGNNEENNQLGDRVIIPFDVVEKGLPEYIIFFERNDMEKDYPHPCLESLSQAMGYQSKQSISLEFEGHKWAKILFYALTGHKAIDPISDVVSSCRLL